MFLTGPGVVREVMGEDVAQPGWAGRACTRANGVCSSWPRTIARRSSWCASCSPTSRSAPARRRRSGRPRACRSSTRPTSCPSAARQVYDMRAVIEALVDGGALLEVVRSAGRATWSPRSRASTGRPVGVIANQPCYLGGVIDAAASQKAARFVRTCNAFGLPLVVLVDTPGFLPGTKQEACGVIRHGAEAAARVRRGRRAEGDGGAAQGLRRRLHQDELEGPGRGPGVRLAGRRDRDHGPQAGRRRGAPPRARRGRRPGGRARPARRRTTRDEHLPATVAAREGFVDEMIEPVETRRRLARRAGERWREPGSSATDRGTSAVTADLVALGDCFTAGLEAGEPRWVDELARAARAGTRYENLAWVGRDQRRRRAPSSSSTRSRSTPTSSRSCAAETTCSSPCGRTRASTSGGCRRMFARLRAEASACRARDRDVPGLLALHRPARALARARRRGHAPASTRPAGRSRRSTACSAGPRAPRRRRPRQLRRRRLPRLRRPAARRPPSQRALRARCDRGGAGCRLVQATSRSSSPASASRPTAARSPRPTCVASRRSPATASPAHRRRVGGRQPLRRAHRPRAAGAVLRGRAAAVRPGARGGAAPRGDAVFKRPVRIGDTVHVEGKIVGTQELDDEHGLVACRWRVLNQRDRLVMRADVEVLWRREADAQARRGAGHSGTRDARAGAALDAPRGQAAARHRRGHARLDRLRGGGARAAGGRRGPADRLRPRAPHHRARRGAAARAAGRARARRQPRADLAALSEQLGARWDRVDGALHAIAFAPQDALGGNFIRAAASRPRSPSA